MEIICLIGGILIGLLAGWLLGKSGSNNLRIEEKFVQKTLYDETNSDLRQKNQQIVDLNSKLAGFEERSRYLEKRLEESKIELTSIHDQMRNEFTNLSNRIFEEKSNRFIELNEQKVAAILSPLKEKIRDFEQKVDETFKEEVRERISLKKELENIVKLNQQVSYDAVRLTNALRGDKRLQGEWGEIQLELILSNAGLEKDIHYRKQESFRDDTGKNLRPDYIINLPEEKHLIIDSKVSLVAYEQYFNGEDSSKNQFLKTHIQNIGRHIAELSAKNYQNLNGVNPPDFVLMFIPLDAALYIAMKEDNRLFEKALEKNVMLVTTSTLFTTLRLIAYIWKQDNQRKNVFEIAKESGLLYDKFVRFMDDLKNLGKKIEGMRNDYSSAMNKLNDSSQQGGTIIGKIEKIKKLGANTTKSL